MKALIAAVFAGSVVGLAIGFGSVSFGLASHDHSSHSPIPIPETWTDAQVAAFIAESDRKIEGWAGRAVAPGEVITHDGLEFKKSTPDMVAQRSCVWCPTQRACHGGEVAVMPRQPIAPKPVTRPRPASAPIAKTRTECVAACQATWGGPQGNRDELIRCIANCDRLGF
jgi:hypothetical protein